MSKRVLLPLAGIVAIGALTAHAGIGARPAHLDRSAQRRMGFDDVTSGRARGRAGLVELEIMTRVGLPREDIVQAIRLTRSNEFDTDALHRILKASLKSSDPETTGLIRSYLTFLKSGAGSFHFMPTEMELALENFTPAGKQHLAMLFDRSSRILISSQAGTREEAFRKALRETGLEKRFAEECKK